MKKSFVGIIITLLVTVFMAAPLWAGTLERKNQNGADAAITVASERCDFNNNQLFDLDMDQLPTPVGMAIIYTPELSTIPGDLVELELSNATFADTELFLVLFEGNVDGLGNTLDLDGDGYMELQVVGQYVGTVKDSNKVTMRVTDFGWEPNWKLALISSNVDTNLGVSPPPIYPSFASYDYNIIIKPLSVGDDYTVGLQVNWMPGSAVPSGIGADEVDILSFTPEFGVSFNDPAEDCIFIGKGRVNFRLSSSSPYTESHASMKCTTNDVDLPVQCEFTITATVTSSTFGAVDSIEMDGNLATINAAKTEAVYSVTYPAGTVPPTGPIDCDIVINVDGVNVIAPRIWTVDFNLSTADCTDVLTVTNDFLEWGFCDRGTQLKTYQTISGEDAASPFYSFINLVNEMAVAQVWADVLFSDGTVWENVQLVDVPHGSMIYRGYDVIAAGEAAGKVLPTGVDDKYELTLTVTAKTNFVHAWAFEVRDGEQRTLSVFTEWKRHHVGHRWFN